MSPGQQSQIDWPGEGAVRTRPEASGADCVLLACHWKRAGVVGSPQRDTTTHYSAPELQELPTATNRVCEQKSGNSG